MEPSTESISRGWIAAIVALLILLVVGLILFMRMSSPLKQAPKKAVWLQSTHGHNSCNRSGKGGCNWV